MKKTLKGSNIVLEAISYLNKVTGYLQIGVGRGEVLSLVAEATSADVVGVDSWEGAAIGMGEERVRARVNRPVTLVSEIPDSFKYNLALISDGRFINKVIKECSGLVIIYNPDKKLAKLHDFELYGDIGVVFCQRKDLPKKDD